VADLPAGEPRGRPKLIFAIVSIGLFMASIDQTIVATALPAIQHELHTRLNWSGWTITIYALGQVVAGIMQAHVFVVFACLLVVLIPAVWWLVPDHRGSW